jgi:hypothetical protein
MPAETGRHFGALGVVACGVGFLLALANGHVALQVYRVGAMIDAELAGQALALGAGSAWFAWARSPSAGLVLTGLSLWVYWGMAPVIGQVLTGPPSELSIWLGPVEILAFAFFPLAFFAWRSVARRPPDATAPASAG